MIKESLESSPYPCFVSRRLLDSHGHGHGLERLGCQTAEHPCCHSGACHFREYGHTFHLVRRVLL